MSNDNIYIIADSFDDEFVTLFKSYPLESIIKESDIKTPANAIGYYRLFDGDKLSSGDISNMNIADIIPKQMIQNGSDDEYVDLIKRAGDLDLNNAGMFFNKEGLLLFWQGMGSVRPRYGYDEVFLRYNDIISQLPDEALDFIPQHVLKKYNVTNNFTKNDNNIILNNKCIGRWEGKINRYQAVKLKIKRNGKYNLSVIQSNEPYNASYSGEWKELSDNTVELPSNSYMKSFNENRRSSDPLRAFENVKSTFFFRSDGALSKSDNPNSLNNTEWFLNKI